MLRVDVYSPATGNVSMSDLLPNEDAVEREISNKVRQFLRTAKNRRTTSPVLFTFGVVPPRNKRDGSFQSAGVALIQDGVVDVKKIGRFSGTLASLAIPGTYRRYLRNIK